jgi:ATP/maltotriose-dependent transcriptional regulator MalT/DNA-binding SARP family transcriptional activator
MAFGEELILRTKLQPPRLRRWILPRERLLTRLEEAADYRLTLLSAPTGYGKSTLLAGWLANSHHPYAWYNLGQLDADPFVFLVHLIYAFRSRFPALGQRALETLEREWHEAGNPTERRAVSRPALHLFINELFDALQEDTFLILDDFHALEAQREAVSVAEELIATSPPNLHIIIASRQRPVFEQMPRWQVQQDLLFVDKESLAFTPAETIRLFEECYGYCLSETQATRLSTETEGWIIALQMIWQNLQSSESRVQSPESRVQSPESNLMIQDSGLRTLDSILNDLPRNMMGLFDYLAQEVLSRQESDLQRFLLDSAVLRRMNGPVCDFVLERPTGESEKILRRLSEAGLFVIAQGEDTARSYRYHHLFGEFLYSRLQSEAERTAFLHARAACYYQQQGLLEDTLHHSLAAHAWEQSAHLLEAGLGRRLIETGRLERLEHWLAKFPSEFLATRPALLLLQGDYLRLTSRFEPALASYRQASNGYEKQADKSGLAQAFRGRALVYLDTVQPAAAEEWLERALEAAETTHDRTLNATLLRDLAENKLNRGRPLEAEELYRKAQELFDQPEEFLPSKARILLRSGRIYEAIEFIEQTETGKPATSSYQRAGRSHRESLLVLSLLYSIIGEGERAIACAEQGIFLARTLRTPFTEGVAWQRLGHALTVHGEYERALEAYAKGQSFGAQLQVRRLQAEGLMGRCLLLGRANSNKLSEARRAGEEGLQVARQSGDEWIEGFIQLSLAAALTVHGEHSEALGTVQIAKALLENCGDRFGQTVARLWLALASDNLDQLKAVCQECEQNGYGFLLERPTFFGPKSPEILEKLKKVISYQSPVNNSPSISTPDSIKVHSALGTQPSVLRVTTLGGFGVQRPDGSELGLRDWQREKARLLFQLLLTHRHKPLPKEQILEYLWPESEPTAADTRFKVVLNALVRALEPERSSRSQSNYIIRSGSGASLAYSLNTDPEQIWLDATEFENLATQGAHAELLATQGREAVSSLELYNRALELYRGDFLPGCLYEDWAAPERERLLALFLATAERLTRLLAEAGEWERCVTICRLILARDNCWEEAYRRMMLAQWKQGNRAAALRTYEKCTATLSEELGVEPMPQTLKLYQEILQD